MSGIAVPSFNSSERAHELVKRIAGHCWAGKGDMIDRVFDAISDHYPSWTRRRVRGLFHREAAKIDWREIRELEVVSEIERKRREASAAARSDHNDFLMSISNTLSRMEATDAEFHSQHREAFCEMAFGSAHHASGYASRQGDQDPASRRTHIGVAD